MSWRSIQLSLLLPLLLTALAVACPMCRESVMKNSNGTAAASALPFNVGIFYMLGVIAVVGGFIGTMIWRGIRDSSR